MEPEAIEAKGRETSGSESTIDWITLDEVNALIYDEPKISPDDLGEFLTSAEWAAHWGIHERTAQRKLAKLGKIGKTEAIHVTRQGMNGYSYQCLAYRIIRDSKIAS